MTLIQNSLVTVMVTDMTSALAFYVDVLGLNLTQQYGNHWAEVEAPGLRIGLHPSDKPLDRGENLQIAFRVDKLEEGIRLLESHGIAVNVTADGPVQMASFHDPDRNSLYFVQE